MQEKPLNGVDSSLRLRRPPLVDPSLRKSRTDVSVSSRVYRALAEIDRFLAAGALYLFVEFIREDLDRLVTFGTLARERLEFFVGFKSGTMHGCGHGNCSSSGCSPIHFSEPTGSLLIVIHRNPD
jgi:hypothetical protein